MKHLLGQLDKSLDHRIRLAIVVLLMTDDVIDFSTFKTLLNVTDGNLASQMSGLEKAGYITFSKRFQGRKPVTEYSLTTNGRAAVLRHLAALEELIHTKGNSQS